MSVGMLATVFLFAIDFRGNFAIAETVLTAIMSMLGVLTVLDRKRFVFYELSFIFLSHASILIAVFALG